MSQHPNVELEPKPKAANLSVLPSSTLPLPVISGSVLVMFLWALCFPLITVGLAASPPMMFATLRAALSGVVLLCVAQYLKRPPIVGASSWVSIAIVGVTATSLGFFGMFYGGGRVSPGLATVIANTQPLIAAALAFLLLKERLSVRQRLGMIVGFLGIVFIALPSLSGSNSQLFGIAFIVAGAVGVAISNVVLKQLAGHVDGLRAMGWQLVIGSVPLAVLAGATENATDLNWSLSFVLVLITISIVGTSAAFALWFFLLRQAALSRLNVFTFLTPIFGLTIGVAVFGETIHFVEIVGITLSILGIYWVTRQPRTNDIASVRSRPD